MFYLSDVAFAMVTGILRLLQSLVPEVLVVDLVRGLFQVLHVCPIGHGEREM